MSSGGMGMTSTPSLSGGSRLWSWLASHLPLIGFFVIVLSTSTGPLPLPSESFPIHHKSVVLPFDAIQSTYDSVAE
jgi:hypothetical protein